jgi:hypothetical protein
MSRRSAMRWRHAPSMTPAAGVSKNRPVRRIGRVLRGDCRRRVPDHAAPYRNIRASTGPARATIGLDQWSTGRGRRRQRSVVAPVIAGGTAWWRGLRGLTSGAEWSVHPSCARCDSPVPSGRGGPGRSVAYGIKSSIWAATLSCAGWAENIVDHVYRQTRKLSRLAIVTHSESALDIHHGD